MAAPIGSCHTCTTASGPWQRRRRVGGFGSLWTTLLELEELRQLKARYCRLLHTKRWAQWRIESSVLTKLRDDIRTPIVSIHLSKRARDECAEARRKAPRAAPMRAHRGRVRDAPSLPTLRSADWEHPRRNHCVLGQRLGQPLHLRPGQRQYVVALPRSAFSGVCGLGPENRWRPVNPGGPACVVDDGSR